MWVSGEEDGCYVSSFRLTKNKSCLCTLNHLNGFDGAGWDAQEQCVASVSTYREPGLGTVWHDQLKS